MKAKGLRSRYAQGLRVTDEQALTAVKHAAGVLRVEIEALLSQGLPELADGAARGSAWSRATTSPRGRSACARASTSSSPARCARSTPPLSTAQLDAGDVVLVPHARLFADRRSLQPVVGRRRRERGGRAAKPTSYSCTPTSCRWAQGRTPERAHGPRSRGAAVKKEDLTSPQTARVARARGARTGRRRRSRAISFRAASTSSLLLELFTHTGVGTMITADPVEKLPLGANRGRRRHPRADRAARSRGHPGQAQPRAARSRDRQLPRRRARRHDRRLRRALSFPRRQERRVRLPRGRAGVPRLGVWRAAAQGCEERAKGLKHAAPVRAYHACRALVPRTGLPCRRVAALPSQRQALYNWRRGSKVFLKRL